MGSTGRASPPFLGHTCFPGVEQNPPGEGTLPLEALAGHTQAVDLLYWAYREAGRVLARVLRQNERDAEDIFQEAFTGTINPGDGAPRVLHGRAEHGDPGHLRDLAGNHAGRVRARSPAKGPEGIAVPGPASIR